MKQGVDVWNKWRAENLTIKIDLSNANLSNANLHGVDLSGSCWSVNDSGNRIYNITVSDLHSTSDPKKTRFIGERVVGADLSRADFSRANLGSANLTGAQLVGVRLIGADLRGANLIGANLKECNLDEAGIGGTIWGNIDLREVHRLDQLIHMSPSTVGTDTFELSKGKIPETFLRGCGLPDWEIESAKLYNPDLTNEEINKAVYKIYDLRATQAIQISPLFISYSHGDTTFVNKLEDCLNQKGIRFWRDVHDLKSGRIETQVDRAIRQNPTVLLILSEHSLESDWVEHEVRTARSLEKEIKRDVLCPVALDNSWKNSPWSKRIMEQIMEYNILDFSEWKDDAKFESTFNKLIDGLELFYK